MQTRLHNIIRNAGAGLLAALAGISLASCGGGSGSVNNLPGPGGAGQPRPGTADLQGQLLEGASGRVASAAGSLAGIPVSLINTLTGALQGTQTTSAAGGFEFKAIPSGNTYLLKVEFTAAQDLDGDGVNDQVELYFPLSVADQSITQLVQSLSLDDSNSDGSVDSIVVSSELGDDKGGQHSDRRQHRFRDGRTVEDSNNNGSFSDDSGFDDSNCDNLPDSSSTGEDNSGAGTGLSGIELFGALESINSSSFTVGGVTFAFTSATEWQVGDNHHADPSQFPAGTQVKVEGFASSTGYIATEVKTGQGSTDDTPGSNSHVETFGVIEALGADSITIGGVAYAIDAATEWKLDGNHAAASQFSVGMQVKIEAAPAAGGYLALEIKSGADSGSDDSFDDNGGNGGTDDSVDDNGGNGGTDDSTDDNGGHGGDDTSDANSGNS